MKTIKNLIGKICTFPNAIKAYMKARKCKRLRPEVLEFEQNREDNLQKAIDAIQSGEYTPGKYRIFKVWGAKRKNYYGASVLRSCNSTHDRKYY